MLTVFFLCLCVMAAIVVKVVRSRYFFWLIRMGFTCCVCVVNLDDPLIRPDISTRLYQGEEVLSNYAAV